MSFLHAVATKQKELEDAGDHRGLMNLPNVTVFEKASAPGGVWRSNRNDEGGDSSNGSTNMYEGLWINGHKDGMEFFDYTYKDHFKTPQPVYLPRQQILEYLLSRVTKHDNIFEDVNFNTEVLSVEYNDKMEQFVVQFQTEGGMKTTQYFDKCIWAAGMNGQAKMIPEILGNLSNYKGQIVHSTEMGKLSSAENNAVKGKHILMIGDSYSAEDLALQCLKLGAEKISITTRNTKGTASYMGSWPEDRVDNLNFSQVAGVKDDNTGTTISFDSLDENYPASELTDVSIVIFCTGYKPNTHFLHKDLQPFSEAHQKHYWRMEDIGIDTSKWRMKDTPFTNELGHVEPSIRLESTVNHIDQGCYRRLLIKNPNMMILNELCDYPLLDIDVGAWLCLAYITGERRVPTEEEMNKGLLTDLLEAMNDHDCRTEIDNNYAAAADNIPSHHWNDNHHAFYRTHFHELYSFPIRQLARSMQDANYPLSFGNVNQLNKNGLEMVRMMCNDSFSRYDLAKCDDETKRWKTFRDADPSPYRSFLTGMGSTGLSGRWLDIDDSGQDSSTMQEGH